MAGILLALRQRCGETWHFLLQAKIRRQFQIVRETPVVVSNYIQGRAAYKNWPFLAWKGPEVVVMRLAARTWTQLRGEFRQHVKDNSEQLLRHPTLASSLPIREQRSYLHQPYVQICISVLIWTQILYMSGVMLQIKVQNLK